MSNKLTSTRLQNQTRNNYLDWKNKTKNPIHHLYIDIMLEKLDRGEKLSWDESVVKYYDKATKQLYFGLPALKEGISGRDSSIKTLIDNGRIIRFK